MEHISTSEAKSCLDCQEFPTFHGNRRFITLFTRSRLWTLTWASRMQSTHLHPIFKINFNIILPSRSRSPKWSEIFKFTDQNFVSISDLSHASYMSRPTLRPWFDYAEENRLRSSWLCNFVNFPTLPPSYVHIFSSAPCSQTPSTCTLPLVWGTRCIPIQNNR
jgi:hypothetical protein